MSVSTPMQMCTSWTRVVFFLECVRWYITKNLRHAGQATRGAIFCNKQNEIGDFPNCVVLIKPSFSSFPAVCTTLLWSSATLLAPGWLLIQAPNITVPCTEAKKKQLLPYALNISPWFYSSEVLTIFLSSFVVLSKHLYTPISCLLEEGVLFSATGLKQ